MEPGGESTSILGQLLWSVFRAPVKGALGETAVKAGAALALPSSVYRRYHDVTLPTAGGTTQIDHVFVSVFGVFVFDRVHVDVIEDKNSDLVRDRRFLRLIILIEMR